MVDWYYPSFSIITRYIKRTLDDKKNNLFSYNASTGTLRDYWVYIWFQASANNTRH